MNAKFGICNLGVGINLNNTMPTVCINSLIKEFNTKLPEIKYEQLLALIFNELERLYNIVQSGNLKVGFGHNIYRA